MIDKSESFEDFMKRVAPRHEKPYDLATVIHFSSVYCAEKKLNPRRCIMRIRRILEAHKELSK